MHSPCFFFGASLQYMAQMLTRHTFSSAIRCMIKMGSKQSFAHSAKIILPVFRTLPINNLRRKWHGCRMSRMSVSKASVLPAVVQRTLDGEMLRSQGGIGLRLVLVDPHARSLLCRQKFRINEAILSPTFLRVDTKSAVIIL